jgi:hypothetical protein
MLAEFDGDDENEADPDHDDEGGNAAWAWGVSPSLLRHAVEHRGDGEHVLAGLFGEPRRHEAPDRKDVEGGRRFLGGSEGRAVEAGPVLGAGLLARALGDVEEDAAESRDGVSFSDQDDQGSAEGGSGRSGSRRRDARTSSLPRRP